MCRHLPVLQPTGFHWRGVSIYQYIQYFIWIKDSVWILPQLDIFCTSAVKWYYAETNNLPFTWHLYFHVWEFIEPKKLATIWLVSYFGDLCNKNCVTKGSKTLIIWHAFSYTAGSDKPGCNKWGVMVCMNYRVYMWKCHICEGMVWQRNWVSCWQENELHWLSGDVERVNSNSLVGSWVLYSWCILVIQYNIIQYKTCNAPYVTRMLLVGANYNLLLVITIWCQIGSIGYNKVTLRWAGLVQGWVTIHGYMSL